MGGYVLCRSSYLPTRKQEAKQNEKQNDCAQVTLPPCLHEPERARMTLYVLITINRLQSGLLGNMAQLRFWKNSTDQITMPFPLGRVRMLREWVSKWARVNKNIRKENHM